MIKAASGHSEKQHGYPGGASALPDIDPRPWLFIARDSIQHPVSYWKAGPWWRWICHGALCGRAAALRVGQIQQVSSEGTLSEGPGSASEMTAQTTRTLLVVMSANMSSIESAISPLWRRVGLT